MKTLSRLYFTLAFLMLGFTASFADDVDPNRFLESIQAFEKQDAVAFPPEGSVLFTGSSSIRLWDLEAFFPGKGYINRGFGGSHLSDLLYFTDRIVLPYKPRLIFMYEGDNDISDEKSPNRVLADFQKFVQIVHSELPETHIVYLAIKTSHSRWDKHTIMRRTNFLIREYCRQFDFLDFLDTETPLLGDDEKPNPAFFNTDELHLNQEGYRVWQKLVTDYMAANS
jgi:lysophospholipase L1-like esterase